MNAIIALCHFCDTHGPKTLFCTQAFKFVDIKTTPNINHKNINNFQLNAIKQSASSDISSTSSSLTSATNITCKACRAFEKTFENYISYDNNAKICYISQSEPSDSEVFSLLRKACLRTLHCEVFEDPIYFDDDKNGSVIGYEFHVKDSQGRGYQRSYSLLIIMKDRIYLQHLWSFLQQQMSIVAQRIKQSAQRIYEQEIKKDNQQPQGIQITTHSNVNMFNKTKSPNKSTRGLIDLTQDKLIFAKLHMWFTWILRACALKITEEFLHGPSIEDMQVKYEQNEDIFCITNDDKHLNDEINNDNIEIFDGFLFYFDTFKDLLKVIENEIFHQIAYNVIIGNQVIIRCKYPTLVKSVLQLLEQLIPYGCRKSTYFSNEYIKSYKCNLLGLNSETSDILTIDNQILDDYILVNILVQYDNVDNTENNELKTDLYDLNYFKFKVSTKTKSINQCFDNNSVPEILKKLEKFIFNDTLDPNTVNQLIRWTREEWLNKAKVCYKYARTNLTNNDNTKTLLKILQLEEKDMLALKFWQTGLSNDCKSLIRAT